MKTKHYQNRFISLFTRHNYILCLILFCSSLTTVFAQSPQKISYQSVVRDASNNLLSNATIGVQISILQGSANGTNVYTETYNPNPQTNINGLVTLAIGTGIPSTGVFSNIDWANGPFFLRIGIDPTGGTDYTINGISELLSVPYALYAETSGDANTNESWNLSGNTGTSELFHFLGTTDDEALKFKVSQTEFGSFNPISWHLYLGREAGKDSEGGSHNIGLGNSSLRNSDGNNNIGIGNLTLTSSITGDYNIGIGYRALVSNTANNNIGIGYEVLEDNTTGTNNVALGNDALESTTTGSENTAIGNNVMLDVTIGGSNTALGSNAMASVTSSSNNTAIGTNAMPNATGFNNTAIGHDAELANPAASHQVRIGDTQITSATIQVPWTITSDKKWKEQIRSLPYGLDFISKLKPVDYIRKNNEAKTREIGFVAQDVENTLAQLGFVNQGLLSKDVKGNLSLRYNDLIPVLTKAIQELNSINKDLLKRIELLEQKK